MNGARVKVTEADTEAGTAVRASARSGLLFARRDEQSRPAQDVALRADPSDAQVVDLENGEIGDIWTYYRMTRALAARENLILFYSPLVGQVATRVGMRLPNTVEQADLVSYGMFGLIDAIDKFDPDRDIRFETYAQTRVRGAIIDGLRSMDWVPRSVRAKARNLERAVEELEATLRRAPSREELAAHLGIAIGELDHMESANATSSIVALDELLALGDGIEQRLAPTGTTHHEASDPAGSYEAGEQRRILFEVVGRLGNRDRLILMLYYFECLTLSEIGRILGVTESRISQLHSGAMKLLRAQLTELGVR